VEVFSFMQQQELIPHLFKEEYRKIISVITKRFGLKHIEIAEDIASDTFLTAAQVWGINGIPENPVAWLYNVAANKTKNYLHRGNIYNSKIVPQLKIDVEKEEMLDLSPQNIIDSQLQMMFAISHPSISAESQIGLSLKILCGFGIEEIADAFLTNKETINKRLYRAKEKLREENIKLEMPAGPELEERLKSVLSTIYLLFSEGYYSVSNNQTLRKELCFEAIRLCSMLAENKAGNTPPVNALLALMCFHASRFDARIGKEGEIVLYEDQDTELWDTKWISKGMYYLKSSASGDQISTYHLQANIAYWNTIKEDSTQKWESILQLYNMLLQIEYSPIAALNRTFALAKANGKKEAVIEAEKLKLTSNHLYYSLLGELYAGLDTTKAKENFQQALSMAKTINDRNLLKRKLEKLNE
jgi:RNA polymerase sigma factor (sigma-70 family)